MKKVTLIDSSNNKASIIINADTESNNENVATFFKILLGDNAKSTKVIVEDFKGMRDSLRDALKV